MMEPVNQLASAPPIAPPMPKKPAAVPASCEICRQRHEVRDPDGVAQDNNAHGGEGHPPGRNKWCQDRSGQQAGANGHGCLARTRKTPARAQRAIRTLCRTDELLTD